MPRALDQTWLLDRCWYTSDGIIFQEWLRGPHTQLRVTNFLPLDLGGYDHVFKFVTEVSDCTQVVSEFCELNDWTLTDTAGPKPGTIIHKESIECQLQ